MRLACYHLVPFDAFIQSYLTYQTEGIYKRARGLQFPHDVGVAILWCHVHRCYTLLWAGVDERLGLEQNVDDVLVAFLCRQMKGSVAFLVKHVYPGAVLDEQTRQLGMAGIARIQ